MAGFRGNLRKNGCWKFESNPEKNHFAVGSWFWGINYPQRSLKNLSQAARWTFPWADRKTTWFTVSRKVSLVAVDDHCLSEPDSNTFECTSSDVRKTYPALHLLDSDHEEDSNIEIEWTLFTLWTAVTWTCKSWILERYRKWLLRKPLKHVLVF